MTNQDRKKWLWAGLTLFFVLLIDQVLKVYIKTNFYLGEELHVLGLSWFRLHFIENEGMAFGLTYGGTAGKIGLTLFRMVAVVFISWYLVNIIKNKAKLGLILAVTLIMAGAIGNIIDSVIYGVLFESSDGAHFKVAQFLPSGGGYAPLLQGKVVDMLYFPLISGQYPDWMPGIGGRYFQFFRPVFNIGDVGISTGVLMILVFHKRFFADGKPIHVVHANYDEELDNEIDPEPITAQEG